jgi:hypothetical protein
MIYNVRLHLVAWLPSIGSDASENDSDNFIHWETGD